MPVWKIMVLPFTPEGIINPKPDGFSTPHLAFLSSSSFFSSFSQI
jgi:hypothetical protein